MVIISDTSPVSNLLVLGRLDILYKTVGEIIIPPKVYQEIIALNQYGVDTDAIDNLSWISVKEPRNVKMVGQYMSVLDEGESEAIVLAQELHAHWLIMDEKIGRKFAKQLKIKTIGLLGILIKARKAGIIILVKPILDDLIQHAGFWISDDVYKMVLNEVGEVDTH